MRDIPRKPARCDYQDCRAQPNRPMTHGFCPLMSVMEMAAQFHVGKRELVRQIVL